MTSHPLPKTIGKYTILDVLGRGAMGLVYKGFDPLIERTVAIKIIRKSAFADDELADALSRFKQEAQAAGRLIHPNIVTVYEYGEENDTAFIAMEYVEGKSLKEILADKPALTLAEVGAIIKQLLTGLQHAHASGIVHRDIKPDNLIFSADNTLKIMDFGVARLESSSLTVTGSVMGTPSYMAPELFSGEKIDQRSDLFSAGIILYLLLTGHKPFSGSSITAIMHQVVNVMPTKPSQVDNRLPSPLDDLTQTALAKNPENRFQNSGDFLSALKKSFAKVDTSLVARGAGDFADSHQGATLYEGGQKQKTLSRPLVKIQQHGKAIIIAVALIFLVIVAFFIMKDPSTAPDASPKQGGITNSSYKKSIPTTRALKTLQPSASKKVVAKQPKKPRTGIAITSPNSNNRLRDDEDRPASRNAITITVPNR